MDKNPEQALDAIIGVGKPLTLGKIALLEKVKSKTLELDFSSLDENIKATYLCSLTHSEAVEKMKDESAHLTWADEIGWDEYEKRFGELVDALIAFYKMLPAQKKTENPSE